MITFWVCLLIFAGTFTWIRKQAKDIKRLEEENEILFDSMEPEAKALLTQIGQDIHGMRGEMGDMKISIAKIDRGMYGDKDNKLPGLIDRQNADEQRIEALEKNMVTKKSVAVWVTSLSTMIAGAGHAFKEIFK